ncbi:hypothetical protein MB02_05260 [Croceicoccus estronivorus]|uniref:hypothetical protein n=1 Tax=Croceicoccus estronivorus TaxID=1172626 RepID=UPI0008322967|nr:hypothetical protein [Croceicoccus estronivorus]OCC24868.1 hypothetical protein MB02_05260 [Croceicoccus estronivorus]
MDIYIEEKRQRVRDAIDGLRYHITEEPWDTCDIADAVVWIIKACDLHCDGNMAGFLLGIPDDYSAVIEGVHFPEVDLELLRRHMAAFPWWRPDTAAN